MNNNYYSELDNYPNIKRLLQKQAAFITPGAPATGGPGSGKEMPRPAAGFKMPNATATGGSGLSNWIANPNFKMPKEWKLGEGTLFRPYKFNPEDFKEAKTGGLRPLWKTPPQPHTPQINPWTTPMSDEWRERLGLPKPYKVRPEDLYIGIGIGNSKLSEKERESLGLPEPYKFNPKDVWTGGLWRSKPSTNAPGSNNKPAEQLDPWNPKPIGFYSKPSEIPHEYLQIGINTPFMREAEERLREKLNLPKPQGIPHEYLHKSMPSAAGFKMPNTPATGGPGAWQFGR